VPLRIRSDPNSRPGQRSRPPSFEKLVRKLVGVASPNMDDIFRLCIPVQRPPILGRSRKLRGLVIWGVSVRALISCGYATMLFCVPAFVLAFLFRMGIRYHRQSRSVFVMHGGEECATPDEIRLEFRARTKTPTPNFCKIPQAIGWCGEAQDGRFT
jgi:hypothetical protein